MDDWRCKIMSLLKHVICPVCNKGILTVVTEVGVEQGTTAMFQSFSAVTQGRVYRCDICGKSFVKVDDEFLELISLKEPFSRGKTSAPKRKR